MSKVDYAYIEHLIPRQSKAEKEMLAEFEAGNYTIDNPLIKYNPYLINHKKRAYDSTVYCLLWNPQQA